MAPPPEENTNPYRDQTEHNTDTAWLHDDGYKNVKADLDGMADYAANMAIIRDNLNGNVSYLNMLATLPGQAWEPGALPEGAYTAKLMRANYSELQQYLSFLWQALNNIGSAAQTIAQAYAGTDGWSAADLNSVKFAYGDRRVAPPSGIPRAWLDHIKTWQEMYTENMRNGNAAASGVIVEWTDQQPYTDATGTHYVATSSDGVTRHVTEFYVPGGGQFITTTTITYPPSAQYPNGRVVTTQTRSTTSLIGGDTVETTTQSYGPDGQLTGREVETTTYQDGDVTSHGTTTYGADNQQSGSTRTTTNPNSGTTTITTTSGPNDQTPREVRIGAETEGADTTDSPYQDAINEARAG